MEPLLEARLNALEKKVDDTYKIVSQMRRVQRNANIFKLLYWLVIIVLGFAAMFLIKPYISMLGEAYGGFGGDSNTSSNSLIDQYKSLQDL